MRDTYQSREGNEATLEHSSILEDAAYLVHSGNELPHAEVGDFNHCASKSRSSNSSTPCRATSVEYRETLKSH